MSHSEYMSFFERWLQYQFPRVEDDWNNFYILKEVSKITLDDDDLKHWSNRDCWSMYDLAKSSLKEENYAK